MQAVPDFEDDVLPVINAYCMECHGGAKVKGKVNFKVVGDPEQLDVYFDTWATAVDLLQHREMPPAGEEQPSEVERRIIESWYQERFVNNIEARPAPFKPRRLSNVEYRNTLRDLFGFDLEVAVGKAEQTIAEHSLVMVSLPSDPPGRSGFTNDTHGNPLSSELWSQYAFLVSVAINQLFSPQRQAALEVYTGKLEADAVLSLAQAEQALVRFVSRAWRRPPAKDDVDQMMMRIGDAENKSAVLKEEMRAVLMSPRFLYRGMLVRAGSGVQPVDAFELAERLSYFITGSLPDAELSQVASSGALLEADAYTRQIDRLLTSPRVRNLTEYFAWEWLALEELERTSKNPPHMLALKSQAVDFLHYLFTENRPLTELVDSRVAFVNPLTQGYYHGNDRTQLVRYQKPKGIEIEHVPNQKITLVHTKERGGILTMPGILTMNKGPVIRGTWILERILGEHLPDPPMNVGVVPPNRKGESLSFRERFERHQADPGCAVCHKKIDPLGFALDRFNNGGRYTPPGKNSKINTSGIMPGGESFESIVDLKRILVTSEREKVVRNLVERMMSFALGRKLGVHDQPVVREITRSLNQEQATYRDLVHAVANSLPFTHADFSGNN